jgi:hypothetical protein
MNEVFEHLHMPTELAIEFFAIFSRFEYALKATGTYAMDSGGGKAAANWDLFANHIDGSFNAIEDADFKNAVGYLLEKPPRKQIYNNGIVSFKEQKIDGKQTKAQQTLLMIRTVRNNLFHGGKHIRGDEREPGRNEALVTSSLNVLRRCIGINEAVSSDFTM